MVDRECVCTYDQTNGLPPHHCEVSSLEIPATRTSTVSTAGFYNYYGI